MEEAKTAESELDVVEGMQFDRGLMSGRDLAADIPVERLREGDVKGVFGQYMG